MLNSNAFQLGPDGVTMPDSSQILAMVQDWWAAALGDDLNTNPATPQGQIMASEAAAIQDKNSQLLYVAQMFDPQTAEGQWQDALAKIYFLTRKPAQATVVQVLCTGLAGTVIPGSDTSAEPAQVQTTGGTILTCTETGTIGANGTVTLDFAAAAPGPLEIAADSISGIVQAIPGWDTAQNPEAGITGENTETRTEFEARRYASVALNARSVAGAVYAEVGQLPGVLDLVVRQNRTSAPLVVDEVTLAPHSIFVNVLGGENADIAQAIYNSLSAGCDYNGNTSVVVTDAITGAQENVTFTRPEAMPIGVNVTIRKNSQTPSNVEALIKSALVANFYGESTSCSVPQERVHMGDDLYSSRFYPSILDLGVSEVESITLADLSASPEQWGNFLHIPIDRAPSLAADNVTVTVNTGA